ncbi:MAG TPA: PA14 domain-containing protein [Planctomycetota bacterium]|nr:PA14 domain-containing protein [Planctomycetota bacterium]
MNRKCASYTVSLLLLVSLFSPPAAASQFRIAPLGDSITHGSTLRQTYRYPLWKKLLDGNISFDFVGSMYGNEGGNPDFPPYLGQNFDMDHEGHRAYRADQIVAELPGWMQGYTADIVLLHIGTNDCNQSQSAESTVLEIKQIIDLLRINNPSVTILLAKIIPIANSSVNSIVINLNSQIPGIAAEKSTALSRIIVVDHYTGFDTTKDMLDSVHPNAAGEEKMAQKWYDALVGLFGSTGTGLTGEYYDNPDFTNLKFTRVDPTVNFNYNTASPDPSMDKDTFSIRWTGQVEPRYTQTYTFYTYSDDGVRLWVNGQLLIDNWTIHAPVQNSGSIALTAGRKVDIKMEYFEGSYGATISLSWSSPSQAKQIIPQSQLYPTAPLPAASAPAISPNGGNFSAPVTVTLETSTAGASIRYTTDGSTPSSTNGTLYTGPFSLSSSATVRAIAFASGMRDSSVSSANFVISTPVAATPTISPNGGTFSGSVAITLATSTAGASMRYTLDGSDPSSTNGVLYTAPFSVTETATVRAVAFAGGMSDSSIASADFVILPAGTGSGLLGEYYDNANFTNLKFTRVDPTVNFNWSGGQPDPAIGKDTFSIRWGGQIEPQFTETYTFYTVSDDGVRLWVNGQQLIDNWTVHPATENSGSIALTAGQKVDVVLEFYDNTSAALIRLSWSSPSVAKQVIPKAQLFPPAGGGGALASSEMSEPAFVLSTLRVRTRPAESGGDSLVLRGMLQHSSALDVKAAKGWLVLGSAEMNITGSRSGSIAMKIRKRSGGYHITLRAKRAHLSTGIHSAGTIPREAAAGSAELPLELVLGGLQVRRNVTVDYIVREKGDAELRNSLRN